MSGGLQAILSLGFYCNPHSAFFFWRCFLGAEFTQHPAPPKKKKPTMKLINSQIKTTQSKEIPLQVNIMSPYKSTFAKKAFI